MPLPPYIEANEEAEGSYQTVYARNPGSAAAPTAGFHFTEGVLERVELAGAEHEVGPQEGRGRRSRWPCWRPESHA